MPANNSKTYIDAEGLGYFLTTLKNNYLQGTNGFTVKYAECAVGDNGATIQATYATKTQLNDYVTKTTTIAGEQIGTGIDKATLLTKLNVEDGAEVNAIETISVDGTPQTIDANRNVALDLSAYAKKTDIAAALNYRDAKTGSQLAALTASDVSNGDVYTCTADGTKDAGTQNEYTFHQGYEYAAVINNNTLSWVELGKYLDLSGYATITYVDGQVGDLQDNIDAIYTPASGNVAASGYLADEITRATTAEGILDGRLDTLEGDASTEGSVAKSIADAIAALDYGIQGATGQQPTGDYVTGVTQENGVISVSRAAKGNVADGDTGLVDGNAVYDALQALKGDLTQAIENLDYGNAGDTDQMPAGDFVTGVTQTDGKIAVTRASYSTMSAGGSTPATATDVKSYADARTVFDEYDDIIDQMVPMEDEDILLLFTGNQQNQGD